MLSSKAKEKGQKSRFIPEKPSEVPIQNHFKFSQPLPKVRFQKQITRKVANNFAVFNRYLQYKSDSSAHEKNEKYPEAFEIPRKRSEKTFIQRNLYDLFMLEPGCQLSEIKAKFRKLANVHHPDKGGNSLHFRCLKQAFEILNNDDYREIYDNQGFKGLKAISDIETSELESYIENNTNF